MADLRPHRIDRTDLLSLRAFWAVYYYDHSFYEALEWFGFTEEVFDEIRAEMPFVMQSEDVYASYSFTLPLGFGRSVSMDYEGLKDDPGFAYYLADPAWEEPLALCRYPGPYDMPPFRWGEIMLIASAVGNAPEGANLQHVVLPLLFPAVWLTPNDPLEEVHAKLQHSWMNLNCAQPSSIVEWVSRMIEHNLIEEVIQVRDGSETRMWRHDEEFGWINNSWSLRNPSHASPGFLNQVKAFFGAVKSSLGNDPIAS